MDKGDVPSDHFPILIRYKDTDEWVVVKEPKDIENERGYRVVKTSEQPKR